LSSGGLHRLSIFFLGHMHKRQPKQNSNRIYAVGMHRDAFCTKGINAVLHVNYCLHRLSIFFLGYMHRRQPKQNGARIYSVVLQRNAFFKPIIDTTVRHHQLGDYSVGVWQMAAFYAALSFNAWRDQGV
jgi:hypothetical protein